MQGLQQEKEKKKGKENWKYKEKENHVIACLRVLGEQFHFEGGGY